jgi:hypothetical protein
MKSNKKKTVFLDEHTKAFTENLFFWHDAHPRTYFWYDSHEPKCVTMTVSAWRLFCNDYNYNYKNL